MLDRIYRFGVVISQYRSRVLVFTPRHRQLLRHIHTSPDTQCLDIQYMEMLKRAGDDELAAPDAKRTKTPPLENEKMGSTSNGDLGEGASTTTGKLKDTAPKSAKRKNDATKKVGRGRRGTRNHEVMEGNESTDQPKVLRLPKRQCALLIGFCGSGYSGMQM